MDKLTKMTLPNYLSLFRVFISPVIIYLILKEMNALAFILFAFAVLSDAIDGFLARKYHRVTELGIFLDPFADKILLVSILSILSALDKLPLWIFLIAFGKELILLANWLCFRFIIRETRIRPNLYGKSASLLLMLLILSALAENLNHSFFRLLSNLKPLFMYSSAFFVVISLLSYMKFGISYVTLYQKEHPENLSKETNEN